MKQFFEGPLDDHARNIMRKLSYGEQRRRDGQISYVKRMGAGRFPRMHAYVEDINEGMQVNLHLDQKEASYNGTSAHGGEYEGPLVEKEMLRIRDFIKQINKPTRKQTPLMSKPKTEKKKSFWDTLFS